MRTLRRRVSYMSNELHESLLEKTNFWQNVLERLVHATFMLAKCCLTFCGSSEELLKDNKGNFLSVIQLLAKYDIVLDKILQLSKGSPKILNRLIQNELISVLAEELLHDKKSKLQSAPFLPLFLPLCIEWQIALTLQDFF